MKVAIPTFGQRVSPRFDCAGAFLIVTLERGQITAQAEFNATDWAPHERINRLIDLGVDEVICGGIDCWSAESLASVGITLHRWVSGPIQEGLDALRRGELSAGLPVASDAPCGLGRGQRRGRRRNGRSPPYV